MKLLFVGDVVGAVGRKALKDTLPKLRSQYKPDAIVVNGENAANGRGISKSIVSEMFEIGVNVITLGNHAWDQKEIFEFIDADPRLIRPANFPSNTPGRGFTSLKIKDQELVVINLQGRTFLPPLDCPFQKVDTIISGLSKKNKFIFVDFHAEATSEKIAMGWHLDGRVSAVVGTHTHVQSHDERILPGGTAYLTDVGMVGPRDGILGMEKNSVLQKFKTALPSKFVVDEGKWQFHATLIDLNDNTGFASSIKLIRIYENEFTMT